MNQQSFNDDFKIPEKLVGLVIGRGGEQIKRLQMESGCKIRIEADSNGTPERNCSLFGTQDSINEAKRMLDDVVRRGLSRQNGAMNGGYNNGGNFRSNGYGNQFGNNNYQSR